MQPTGAEAASILMKRLKQARTSPTVLYYLALPTRILKKSELGQLLIELCSELNVLYEFKQDFFLKVHSVAKKLEIVPGSFFRVEKSKELAVESFRRELQRRRALCPSDRYLYMGATMPSCFQTLRGRSDSAKEHSDSLFVVHSCPELAFHHAVDLLRAGECSFAHQVIPVMQVYEMRLHYPMLTEQASNRLGCIIVDWEVKESEVAGRLTRQELRDLCEEFPLWLYQQMHRRRHVENRAVVTAVVKNKTRDLPGGDRKHSIHAVYNVCGVPATDLQHILRDCIRDSAKDLRNFKSKDPEVRAKAFVDPETGVDRIGDHPELGFDEAGITGNTGVAVMFSRKRPEDPYPGLVHTVAFSEGCVHVLPQVNGVPTAPNPEPFSNLTPDGQHDLARLTQQQAVYYMYMASCSAARPGMVAPTRESTEGAQVRRIRTAAWQPATSVAPPSSSAAAGGAGSGASVIQLLPKWFRDFVSGRGGQERPNAALGFANQLRHLDVKGADPSRWLVTHYHRGFPCPVLLSDPHQPSVHYHSSNGVILAYNESLPDLVFARCSHCSGLARTNDDVERVKNSSWVRLWEEGFKSVMEKAERKTLQRARADKAVKQRNRDYEEKQRVLQAAKEAKKKRDESRAGARPGPLP
jgi:hypothetical protein